MHYLIVITITIKYYRCIFRNLPPVFPNKWNIERNFIYRCKATDFSFVTAEETITELSGILEELNPPSFCHLSYPLLVNTNINPLGLMNVVAMPAFSLLHRLNLFLIDM